MSLPRPRRVKTPLLVLGAANDRVFSVAEQQKTARAYHTEAILYPDMAHDMMLEAGWGNVANQILGWLDERHLELIDHVSSQSVNDKALRISF